jgi:predicted CXXCH cytochrome family protein
VIGYAALVAGYAGCEKKAPGPIVPRTVAHATAQTAASCRACHETQFAAWTGTDHARANRPLDPAREAAALAALPAEGKADGALTADMILGHRPLWQPLVPQPGGRWQAHELAFDPAKQEWFNVFGAERRAPGEWGHWTGRGMNWNSMCAHCHMTGYEKNYTAATDTYHSSWVEQGVGCLQCHGAMPADHNAPNAVREKSPAPFHGDRVRLEQTCAPCHARNELLTADFQPGDNYADHFRVTLPVEPAVFYPDGQVRDEDFNWTSILLSRMGHAGVTCLDCHDPHSTKTILPTDRNQLCLQCHAAPGRVLPSGVRAVPIDPVAHSHHAEGSTGNQCVTCHMPVTTYMQRAPRHDHGWLKPDPLLTQELGIPNACNRCHTDRPVAWAIEKSTAWYGAKLDSRQRARARAVAAAQAAKPGAAAGLLAQLKTEDVPAWRATLLSLATPYAGQSVDVVAAAKASLAASDPLERSAAVRLLGGGAATRDLVRPLLRDPVRLVRLDAEWALSPELAPASAGRAELDAYLALGADQPAGRLRLGQDWANRGDLPRAEAEIRRAIEWDPYSAGIRDALGFVLNGEGRTAEAAAAFFRAAQLAPTDAEAAFRAALSYAAVNATADAETAFRLTVQRNPRFDRAWYNLGLLLAQGDRLKDAADTLRTAEQIAPRVADYPYALATVLLRAGDRAGGRAAAQRALAIEPGHPGATELLRSIK